MRIESLMTAGVVHCRASDSLSDAARAMWENDCGALVVLDAAGALAGILTDRDVCMCSFFGDRQAREMCVEHAMTRRVHTCRAIDPVERAIETMYRQRVRRLPVLDERGKVCGLLSTHDLIRTSNAFGQPAPNVLVRLLAEVSAQRPRPFVSVAGAVDGGRIEGGSDHVLVVR